MAIAPQLQSTVMVWDSKIHGPLRNQHWKQVDSGQRLQLNFLLEALPTIQPRNTPPNAETGYKLVIKNPNWCADLPFCPLPALCLPCG